MNLLAMNIHDVHAFGVIGADLIIPDYSQMSHVLKLFGFPTMAP